MAVRIAFCATINCPLHVFGDEPHVRGVGNWAQLADGVILSRIKVSEVYYCDRCALVLNTRMTTGDTLNSNHSASYRDCAVS